VLLLVLFTLQEYNKVGNPSRLGYIGCLLRPVGRPSGYRIKGGQCLTNEKMGRLPNLIQYKDSIVKCC
jgi:hypothetical protein